MERKPYWNPYVAGVGIGLTMLLAFVVLGTGLGASGAIARGAAAVAHAAAPEALEHNAYTGPWFEGGSPLAYYLVFMAVGVLAGGFLSAALAGRLGIAVERGPRLGASARLGLALLGGLLAGFASRLAGGCTSGVALTGMSAWVPGGWVFLVAMFAAGFAFAPLVRKEWTS
ncbi:MAG: YeeE/YedE family protein [Planctomycetes bacterium]|nr:YeeE/YedE family protein [Planctomycetota bacterium]